MKVILYFFFNMPITIIVTLTNYIHQYYIIYQIGFQIRMIEERQ